MAKRILNDVGEVAEAAVNLTIDTLRQAIASRGSATWVLAGGTSPTSAYRNLVARDNETVEWSKVSAAIGDERHVPLSHSDSNWGQISPLLFGGGVTGGIRQIVPNTSGSVDEVAADYSRQLEALAIDGEDVPRIDLIWLGVGEDGHTLSLFPGHPDFEETGELVRSVRNSPKPPPERITLTLRALSNVGVAIIFATGAGKRDALARAEADGLPIARVAAHVESLGGSVEWLYDRAASGE